jgi:hypothetical protein
MKMKPKKVPEDSRYQDDAPKITSVQTPRRRSVSWQRTQPKSTKSGKRSLFSFFDTGIAAFLLALLAALSTAFVLSNGVLLDKSLGAPAGNFVAANYCNHGSPGIACVVLYETCVPKMPAIAGHCLKHAGAAIVKESLPAVHFTFALKDKKTSIFSNVLLVFKAHSKDGRAIWHIKEQFSTGLLFIYFIYMGSAQNLSNKHLTCGLRNYIFPQDEGTAKAA